jgi:hypothetical protein
MFCANCYKEIPVGKGYYKHQNTNQSFCSLDCMNDWLIYCQAVTLETSESEDEDENNTKETE